jgi:hypothetical protein
VLFRSHNGIPKQATPNTIEEVWESERSWCKPIKLTEKILLKCAMLKHEGWDGQEYWYAVDDEHDPNRFELFETAQGYELPSGYIVDSLHVLQNAYCFHNAGIRELNVEL